MVWRRNALFKRAAREPPLNAASKTFTPEHIQQPMGQDEVLRSPPKATAQVPVLRHAVPCLRRAAPGDQVSEQVGAPVPAKSGCKGGAGLRGGGGRGVRSYLVSALEGAWKEGHGTH